MNLNHKSNEMYIVNLFVPRLNAIGQKDLHLFIDREPKCSPK